MRKFREDMEMTQQQMASAIGVSQGMIHLVEKGERELGSKPIYKLHQLDPPRFPLDQLLQ
jgi:DNA-binding XRE family transcriptional regulator